VTEWYSLAYYNVLVIKAIWHFIVGVPKDYKSPSLVCKFVLRQKCMNDANDLAYYTDLVIKAVWHFIVDFLKDYKSPSLACKFGLWQM
jgi:hypothetical protein